MSNTIICDVCRDRELQQEHEAEQQQTLEKEQQYNHLVRTLKDRVSYRMQFDA